MKHVYLANALLKKIIILGLMILAQKLVHDFPKQEKYNW